MEEIIILNLQDFKNYLDDLYPGITGTSSSYFNAIKRIFKYLNINMEDIKMNDVEKIKQFKNIMDDKLFFEKEHNLFILEAKSYYYKGFISRSLFIFINWFEKYYSFSDVEIYNNNLKNIFH